MSTSGNTGRHPRTRWTTPVLPGLAALALAGCAAPFSDLQSAGLMAPSETEVTASYSSVGLSYEGEREAVQDHLGLQVGHGITDAIEVRGRAELIRLQDNDAGVDLTAVAVGIGPKIRVVDHAMALYLPVAAAFGRDIETGDTWSIHPTLLLSLPVNDVFEINASGKLQLFFDQLDDPFLAGNLGARIAIPGWPIALRPETGILVSPGDEGVFYHFSLGASLTR